MLKEIQQLQQLAREKDREISRITHWPQREKDLDIQRLQRSLAEKERVQATRAVLCSSLAEEADQLRSQLGATVGVCQELLRRLEGKKQEGDSEESRAHPKQSGEVHGQGNVSQTQIYCLFSNSLFKARFPPSHTAWPSLKLISKTVGDEKVKHLHLEIHQSQVKANVKALQLHYLYCVIVLTHFFLYIRAQSLQTP